MQPIIKLNRLHRVIQSWGLNIRPRQDRWGKINLPIAFVGNGYGGVLSSHAGMPYERWWGNISEHQKHRCRQYFQTFLEVDAL